MTYGELRTLIENEQLGWQTPPDAPDEAPLPVTGLGADPAGLISANSSQRVDFTTLGAVAVSCG